MGDQSLRDEPIPGIEICHIQNLKISSVPRGARSDKDVSEALDRDRNFSIRLRAQTNDVTFLQTRHLNVDV